MSCPTCGSSEPKADEPLLRHILYNMRYVNPDTIDRFFRVYTLGKKVFPDHPALLLSFMKHMFGPSQGESAFDLFVHIRREQAKEATG